MGRLVKAEFRKILTTKLWWALLIPTALIALAFALGWGNSVNSISDALSSSQLSELARARGADPDTLPVGLLAISRGINIGLLFPMIFGVFAIAGEYNRKTISTTFLTAPNRGMALSAKMITYIAWGAIYGLVIVAMASLGIAATVSSQRLPDGAQWLGVLGAGIVAGVLATLFGIGVGAVWNSVVGSVITLVIYMALVENLVVLLAFGWGEITWLGGVLPNGTLNGIAGAIGAEAFGAAGGGLTTLSTESQWGLQYFAGAPGAFSWWASLLIFMAWTGVFFAGAWASNQRRDVT